MVQVVFYEKPGCINNTRQKKLLSEAGHTVLARDLLAHPWTAEQLRAFFADLPVGAWFNRSAPRVKNGSVNPDVLSESEAVQAMLSDPLLIRRPLMDVHGQLQVGFDAQQVDAWIGLKPKALSAGDLEGCPRDDGHSCDQEERT